MTKIGLCHNANYAEATLTEEKGRLYKPEDARTIIYWSEDEGYWRACLERMQILKALGITNTIVFNTEAFGGTLLDLELLKERLTRFLVLAGEYGFPIDYIEPLNEIDTTGWDDGHGGEITVKKVLDYTYTCWEVAQDHQGLVVTSPSFLGGPQAPLGKGVIQELAQDTRIPLAVYHWYGRSVQGIPGFPNENWINGKVEDAINDIIPYCGSMLIRCSEIGVWTVAGNYGQEVQRDYIEAIMTFHHPRLEAMHVFAYNDYCPSQEEIDDGKDFGLEDRDGKRKPASIKWEELIQDRENNPGGITVPTEPQTIRQIQDIAYRLAKQLPQVDNLISYMSQENDDDKGAIFNYWLEHKNVGVPMMGEFDVVEGGKAVITAGGVVLYWDGSGVKEV